MIHKIPKKTDSPRAVIEYVLDPTRAVLLASSAGDNPDVAMFVAEIEASTRLNPRVQKLVTHMSLSLSPGEHLTDSEWRNVARDYLRGMGYEGNTFILAKHTDQNHEHVHIVVARVRPDGTCVSDAFERERGIRIVRNLEKKYGLVPTPCISDGAARALTRGEFEQAIRNEEPNMRLELQETVRAAAQAAGSFGDFTQFLEQQGVTVNVLPDSLGRPHGLVYQIDDFYFSGTQLGRGYTLGGLAKLFNLDFDRETIVEAPRLAEPERLTEQIRAALENSSTLDQFLDSLSACGIEVHLHEHEGTPRGISYALQGGRRYTGSELARDLTWGAVQKALGGKFPAGKLPDARSDDFPVGNHEGAEAETFRAGKWDAPSLREAVLRKAETSADFESFRETLRASGIEVELFRATPDGPARGIIYKAGRLRVSGSKLGGGCTLPELAKNHSLRPPDEGREAAAARLVQILNESASRSRTSFALFDSLAQEAGVRIAPFVDPAGAVRGLAYEYQGRWFAGASLGPEFTPRGLRLLFNIRSAVFTGTKTPAFDEESKAALVAFFVRDATAASKDTTAWLEHLSDMGVTPRLFASGESQLVVYFYQGSVFTPSALGPDCGTHYLLQRGIDLATAALESVDPPDGLVVTPTPDPSMERDLEYALPSSPLEVRLDTARKIEALASSNAGNPEAFVAALEREGMSLRLMMSTDSNTLIGYKCGEYYFTPSQLGAEASADALADVYSLSLSREHVRSLETSPALLSSSELREVIRDAAQRARGDYVVFTQLLDDRGIRVVPREKDSVVVGVHYEQAGSSVAGRQLGNDFSGGGLARKYGLEIPGRLTEEDAKSRLTAALQEAALKAEGSFSAFARTVLNQGYDLRLIRDAQTGEFRALTYRIYDHRFSGSLLGPELTLRGLRSHFNILVDTRTDAEIIQKIAFDVSPSNTPAPAVDPEQIARLTGLISHAAQEAGDSGDFASCLDNEGVKLRVYLNHDGLPLSIAYQYEDRFFTPRRDLDVTFDLPGLADSHGLTFHPVRDRVLLDEIGVRMAQKASADKIALIPELAAQILELASESKTFESFVYRLQQHDIHPHLFTRDGEILGISYEYKGVYISGRSLGEEFTFQGLSQHLGLQPPTNVDDFSEISKEVPPGPPNPRDFMEELQDRIGLAALRADRDPDRFLDELSRAGVRLSLSIDEGGTLRGVSYHLQGREYGGRTLGPAYTPEGLHAAYGVKLDPGQMAANDDRVQREAWTEDLARELRRSGSEARILAARALRQSPRSALATVANAQYLLSSLTRPAQLAMALSAQLGDPGRIASDALALMGAFSSPRVAAFSALRLVRSSLVAASKQAGRSALPTRLTPSRLASELTHTYVEAALRSASSAEHFAARLRLAGLEVSLDRSQPGSPAVLYHLGEHLIPAESLGPQYGFRGLQRRFGDDHGQQLSAALSPEGPFTLAPRIGAGADGAHEGFGSTTHRPRISSEATQILGNRGTRPAHSAHECSTPAGSHPDSTLASTLGRSQPDPPAVPPPDAHAPLSPSHGAPSPPGPPDLSARRGDAPSAQVTAPRTPEELARIAEAIDGQMRVLAVPRVDLRVLEDSGSRYFRGLDANGVRETLLTKAPGATLVEFRPCDEPGLQLIRGVTGTQLRHAEQHGFAPALVVHNSGLYDVWIRHCPPGEEWTREIQRYLERVTRLAYGQPALTTTDRYGVVAWRPDEITRSTGEMATASIPTARNLEANLGALRDRLAEECGRLGLPTLTEFRSAKSHLTPREQDIAWVEIAAKKGLPNTSIATMLVKEGSRAEAENPQRALRYSLRVLSAGLQNVRSLTPAAAQAQLLRTAAKLTSLPLTALKVIGIVGRIASIALRI